MKWQRDREHGVNNQLRITSELASECAIVLHKERGQSADAKNLIVSAKQLYESECLDAATLKRALSTFDATLAQLD